MLPINRLLIIIFVLLISLSPADAGQNERHEWSRPFMGTVFHIIVYSPSQDNAEEAVFKAFEQIEKLEETLSFYRENSELNQLARRAFNESVTASPDLLEVLEAALYWSRQTGGAFDCTIRPLITLWHSRGKEGLLVSADEIAETRNRMGYDKVLINSRLRSVRLNAPEMQLDLGGIAKGFAADKALKSLKQDGFSMALIDAGGDLRLGDSPPGRAGWLITLDNSGNGPSRLQLKNAAVATSGDKYRYYEIEGIRYSHIVNPATGRGMTDHRLVTVISGDTQTADALATALSVMDIQEGLALIHSLDNTEALIRVMDSGPGKIPGQNDETENSSVEIQLSGKNEFSGDFRIFKTDGFPELF